MNARSLLTGRMITLADLVLPAILVLLAAAPALAIDADLDGVDDAVDNCPGVFNPDQMDDDADTIGDMCDPDADPDADGLPTYMDNCPLLSNPGQHDADMDGAGDLCDNCPNITNVDQADADNDGVGDACETVATTSTHWGALKAWYR